MARVGIESDEWYPVFSVDRVLRNPGLSDEVVEVDDATLNRWAVVFAEFEAVQDELRVLVEKQRTA